MTFVHRDDLGEGLVRLRLDDGAVNALDADRFDEIAAAFGGCGDAAAVVLGGRDGVFSAGLNVKILPHLDQAALIELLTRFGRTVLRIWLEPRPVVAAVTGHAVAAGTMLAMACDHAVAADGDFSWGLTETRIGFPLPEFAIALARANVRADRVDDLLLPGAVVAPRDAVAAGFADELAAPDAVADRAVARARELAALPHQAYAATKRRLRGPTADAVLARLDADLADLAVTRASAPS